jgi:hypothetical protein
MFTTKTGATQLLNLIQVDSQEMEELNQCISSREIEGRGKRKVGKGDQADPKADPIGHSSSLRLPTTRRRML